eukprot:gb/GECG01003334.1/.p1 GENE.gb/GECG01003334.1/~~gb/GECG01003334.1/.p1  ORF type:complete len:116 (+),score=12.65 gb/GECG01003334.1/:1-348(+)
MAELRQCVQQAAAYASKFDQKEAYLFVYDHPFRLDEEVPVSWNIPNNWQSDGEVDSERQLTNELRDRDHRTCAQCSPSVHHMSALRFAREANQLTGSSLINKLRFTLVNFSRYTK